MLQRVPDGDYRWKPATMVLIDCRVLHRQRVMISDIARDRGTRSERQSRQAIE